MKYGKINFWFDIVPYKCSWFFRGLCKYVAFIKRFCRINSFNPSSNSFLMDPWCFDLPIALKPTFINMATNFEHLNISDLTHENHWDTFNLNYLFSANFNFVSSNLGTIDLFSYNYWVWLLKSPGIKISAAIYHRLNHNASHTDQWSGWQKLWKIYVALCVKHFF